MRRLCAIVFAVLVASPLPSFAAKKATTAVNTTVDAAQNVHSISPLIYGVAWGAANSLQQLNATINRIGGDTVSTYNWLLDAANPGSDWYFESSLYPTGQAGGIVDSYIMQSDLAGVPTIVTVPMINWIAKTGLGGDILSGFSVAKYGPQCVVDTGHPDSGNGVAADCQTLIVNNDPNDAYVPNSLALQQGWVQHLVSRWLGAANGGPRYYTMDNEPSNWAIIHRDIHPVGLHATEARDLVLSYSAMVKSVDPNALVMAPDEWSWFATLFSGYDQQSIDYGQPPADKPQVMGGMDYVPWLLSQWRAAGKPVDVVSLHMYPQGGEPTDDVSTAMQLLRNRSTRLLWDPNYVSEDWEQVKVGFIPTVTSWINNYYYSGTPLAITEYNWGAPESINGATAEADLLGIFGRENLFMANYWTVPDPASPTFKAMQMYRNYDGQSSTFGDTSVLATAPNPDNLSIFAARRSSDGALTVMVINKVLSDVTTIKLTIGNFTSAGTAQPYQLTAANVIAPLAPIAVTKKGVINATLPAQSITLFVIPPKPGSCNTANAVALPAKKKKPC